MTKKDGLPVSDVRIRYYLARPGEEVKGRNAPFAVGLTCTEDEAPIIEAVLRRNGCTELERTTGPWEVRWTVLAPTNRDA